MSSKESMLIVDDSKLARMMIHRYASEALPDMEIIEAINGEEALKVSNDKQFTVILLTTICWGLMVWNWQKN